MEKTDSFKFWKAILHFINAKLTNHISDTSHWDMLNTVLQSLFKKYNNLVSKIRESTFVTSVSSEIPSFLNCSSKLNIANHTLMPMFGESYDLTMCHQYWGIYNMSPIRECEILRYQWQQLLWRYIPNPGNWPRQNFSLYY